MKTSPRIPQLDAYLIIRRSIGVLALTLPGILILGSMLFDGCFEIQSSISAYYHTGVRDVFVGFLSAVALFLFAYQGYNRFDRRLSNLACLCALTVVFSPTSITITSSCIPEEIDTMWRNTVHFISAGVFLSILAYFSLGLFTRRAANPTPEKLKRNKIYRLCGYLMLICVVLIGFYAAFLKERFPFLVKLDPIFWLEAIALWSFGTSWLVKGRTLFKDPAMSS